MVVILKKDNQIFRSGVLLFDRTDFGQVLTNSFRSLVVNVDGCTFRVSVLELIRFPIVSSEIKLTPPLSINLLAG